MVERLEVLVGDLQSGAEQLELSEEEWNEMDAEATRIAEESVEFATKGTDPKPEDALKNVYA